VLDMKSSSEKVDAPIRRIRAADAARASSVQTRSPTPLRRLAELSAVSRRHTHTHTHTFNGPFSGTTQLSRYQKGKTTLNFTEARDSEWQWHGPYDTIRYDTRCYFNVRSKADISRLNLPHGNDN